jgi:hypothetical protein
MTDSTTPTTAAEGQATPERERFQRKRGAGFPIVALPEAVAILRKAGRHGNEHSISAFATYLGHSTPNSGSFKRRLAAFRDWKFILGMTGDRVVFTDLGRRIAYPMDPVKEKQDLQEAFQNATLFWRVYDDQAKGVGISPATLANHGVQLGVAPVSKDQFAESLVQSAVEAGFAEMEGDKVVFLGPGNDVAVEFQDSGRASDSMVVAAHEASARGQAEQARVDVAAPETGVGPVDFSSLSLGPVTVGWDQSRRREPEERPTVLQSWDFEVGSLVFLCHSRHPLPASAFPQMGKVMAEIEKLKELLTEGTDSGESAE